MATLPQRGLIAGIWLVCKAVHCCACILACKTVTQERTMHVMLTWLCCVQQAEQKQRNVMLERQRDFEQQKRQAQQQQLVGAGAGGSGDGPDTGF